MTCDDGGTKQGQEKTNFFFPVFYQGEFIMQSQNS